MILTRVRALLWRGRHLLLAMTFLAGLFAVVQALTGMQPALVSVVVANGDLPAGTALEAADVRIVQVPEELVPPTSIRSIADIEGEVLVTALPGGMPLPRSLLLSAEFLETAPPGHRIMPVTIIADGTENMARPGMEVSLYAPPDEFADTGDAILVADQATVVGQGRLAESGGFLSEADTNRVLFLAIPEDRVTLVLGYGARTPMRIVLNTA